MHAASVEVHALCSVSRRQRPDQHPRCAQRVAVAGCGLVAGELADVHEGDRLAVAGGAVDQARQAELHVAGLGGDRLGEASGAVAVGERAELQRPAGDLYLLVDLLLEAGVAGQAAGEDEGGPGLAPLAELLLGDAGVEVRAGLTLAFQALGRPEQFALRLGVAPEPARHAPPGTDDRPAHRAPHRLHHRP